MDNFEFATRNKLRFPYRGQVSVEDLWDLNLQQLNDVYMTLQRQRKDSSGTLIVEETRQDFLLGVQVELVRHVFTTKQVEANEKEQAVLRREEKRRLQELLSRKREEGLSNLSEEELQRMIESM